MVDNRTLIYNVTRRHNWNDRMAYKFYQFNGLDWSLLCISLIINFMLHFMVMLFKFCFLWPSMVYDLLRLVALKVFSDQPQKRISEMCQDKFDHVGCNHLWSHFQLAVVVEFKDFSCHETYRPQFVHTDSCTVSNFITFIKSQSGKCGTLGGRLFRCTCYVCCVLTARAIMQ